jgi:hypothetical protein
MAAAYPGVWRECCNPAFREALGPVSAGVCGCYLSGEAGRLSFRAAELPVELERMIGLQTLRYLVSGAC